MIATLFSIALLAVATTGQAAESARPPSEELAAEPGAVFAVLKPLRQTRDGWLLQVTEVLRGSWHDDRVVLSFDAPQMAGKSLVVAFSSQARARFPDPDGTTPVPPRVLRSFLAGEAVWPDSTRARGLLLDGSADPAVLLPLLDAEHGRLALLAAAELVGRRLLGRLTPDQRNHLQDFVANAQGDRHARELLLQFAMAQPWALVTARLLLDRAGPTGSGDDAAGLLHTALDVIGRHGTADDGVRLVEWQAGGSLPLAEAASVAHRRLVIRGELSGDGP